jgi:hypothetical protein
VREILVELEAINDGIVYLMVIPYILVTQELDTVYKNEKNKLK